MSILAETLANPKLTRGQVLLLVLNSLQPKHAKVSEIVSAGSKLGRTELKKWNVSQILLDQKPKCVRVASGWYISAEGVQYLASTGLIPKSPLLVAQESLRGLLPKINKADVATFVEEVIGALEAKLLRSSVVMSWVGAVAILRDEIFNNRLADFNTELLRRDPKAKQIRTLDDFGYVKEYDFLQILSAISFFGKNVKQSLEKALDLRNGCGHPNSLVIAELTVASHIEILILNVYSKY